MANNNPNRNFYLQRKDREWRQEAENRYGGDTSNFGNANQGGYDRDWWDRLKRESSYWFRDRKREQDYRGRGPKNYQRSEQRIREDVYERLTDDAAVDATNIHVAVQQNEVVLSGTVESRDQKWRAEDVVAEIPGVQHVQNDIEVDRYAERFIKEH